MYRVWIEKEGYEPSEKKEVEIKEQKDYNQAIIFDFELKPLKDNEKNSDTDDGLFSVIRLLKLLLTD